MVLCTVSILFRHVMRVGIRTSFSKPIHRAAHGRRTAIEDMGVDHRSLDVAMAQEFLDRPDIIAGFEQVRGEGMPEGVTSGPFCQSGP